PAAAACLIGRRSDRHQAGNFGYRIVPLLVPPGSRCASVRGVSRRELDRQNWGLRSPADLRCRKPHRTPWPPTPAGTPVPRIFASAGGDMGERLRSLDWSTTSFGTPEKWPSALRLALGLCLNTSIPTAIYWGPDLALLYNDAWAPIAGEKHP